MLRSASGRRWLGGLAVILALAVVGGVATAASVEPVEMEGFRAGNSVDECAQAGDYQFACKIDGDYWEDYKGNGTYDCPLDPQDVGENKITISNSDGTYFDWSAENAIGAVIVKGGNGAHLYSYDPQALSDTELFSPFNPSGNPAEVSHATFCWSPQSAMCYEDETGWSDGTRYNKRGNWATYTPFSTGYKMVDLKAGQHMKAGTVSFSSQNGWTWIEIKLADGWSFGEVAQNVKIQGYVSAPSGNPEPGKFRNKFTASGDSWKNMVSATDMSGTSYDYYGVHVDLLHEVECP